MIPAQNLIAMQTQPIPPLSSEAICSTLWDVADLQLEAWSIYKHDQTKSELQTAVDAQDPQQLPLQRLNYSSNYKALIKH